MSEIKHITHVTLAHLMYDTYCKSVGGKSFKGEPLPPSEDLWADPDKRTICQAWEDTADATIIRFRRYEEDMGISAHDSVTWDLVSDAEDRKNPVNPENID